MLNKLTKEITIMKNFMNYICLFLMILGINVSANAATFTVTPNPIVINAELDNGVAAGEISVTYNIVGGMEVYGNYGWAEVSAKGDNKDDIILDLDNYILSSTGKGSFKITYETLDEGTYVATLNLGCYTSEYYDYDEFDVPVTINVTNPQPQVDLTNYQTYCPRTVSFDLNELPGEAPADIVTKKNLTITAPEDPVTPEGLTFIGWYNLENDQKWNFATDVVTDDMILYAKCRSALTISGDVHLTSSKDVQVYTTPTTNNMITVRWLGKDEPLATKIRFSYYLNGEKVTETNSPFRVCDATSYNVIDRVNNEGDDFEQSFPVRYKPTVYNQLDNYTIRVEAVNDDGKQIYRYADLAVYGRSLPAQFVIAMKNTNDNKWYALPNDLATSTSEGSSTKAPLLISVDNTTTPTKALMAPKNTLYKGDGRYQPNSHRNAIRFLRADAEDKAWITTSSTSQLYMPAENSDKQQFNLLSSDLAKYTITQDGKTGAIAMYDGIIGWYGSSNNTVYLLPVDANAEPAVFDVVEWFPTKLLIESSQAITNTSVQVGTDDAVVGTAGTATYGTNLYEVQTGDLTAKAGQAMSVSYTIETTTYAKVVTVPIILSRGTYATSGSVFGGLDAQSKYQYNDLVVRDGATLTVDATTGTWNTFVNVTIYPTSKVVVPAEKTLKTSLITMRGGYDELYHDGSYAMGYDEPQLYIGGTCSATQVNYEKRVDLDQMHGMSVPFAVEQMAISYLNGASVKEGGNLFIDAYDGKKRADYAGTKSSWYYYDEKETPLYRGVGYTVSGAPTIETQNYAILRFPMATGWTDAVPGSESVAELEVHAWGHDAGIRDNHKGWNCLGNPYLANFGKADDATFGGKLYVGLLVETKDDKGNWTGGYHWNDETVRYVTIPHDDGRGFEQVRVQDAVLKPFRHFFVQVQTDGTLQFAKTDIQNSVVARATNDEPKEIELGILMSNGQVTDNCGLLIGEDFSEGYEMMSDLGKELGQAMAIYTITDEYKLAFNAMDEDYAKSYIPVGYLAPKAGEYTISFDNERYDIAPSVEHIYLLENGAPVADLKSVDYDFETTAGTNDDRFALNIVFNHNIGTDLSSADSMDEMPVKIVHNDKMYILMRGKVYSTTGKFIKAIKK